MERPDESAASDSGSHQVDGRLVDFLPVAIVCLDTLGQAVLVNAGWTELTGRLADAELGEGWLETFDDRVDVQAWIASVVADGRSACRDVWVRARRGPRLIRLSGTPRYEDRGGSDSYVICGTDITDLAAREDRLVHRARHDALTGLLSREEFLGHAKRWDCATGFTGQPSALLFLDVDNFKAINDVAGHGGGDEVLRGVARRMQKMLRKASVLGRYGGDEFAALLVDVTTPSHAAEVAGRILAGLSQPMVIDGRRLEVSASIGVAMTGTDQITGWLERADAALYEAKALGKNRFVVAEKTAHAVPSPSHSAATAAHTSRPRGPAPQSTAAPFHAVHFYDDDDDLLPALTGYISAGLFEDSVVVIAAPNHRRQLRERLEPDLLAAARAANRYVELDAAETLDRFMRDGFPDSDLFQMVVGSTIVRGATHPRRVRAFGEMVSLLWAEGNSAACLRLEDLWTELQGRIAFPLLCAYPISDFPDRPDHGYNAICNHHTQLLKAG